MVEGSKESAISARRSNQSGKSNSSCSSKNSYSSSYSEKSRCTKAREIKEKAKFAELFLELWQRAENQAEALKVHKEMAGAKARMEVYRSHDEVNAEEGSIPPPMNAQMLEFG